MFRGSMVALITPFRGGAVDYEALEALVEWHIAEGTDALVPCGTTGESATLSHAEHKEVVAFVVKKAKGRVPVIAGTGSNSTREAIELAQAAKEVGADAHLSITPYYNKPSQEGLYQHFKAINEAVALPMILYNVPGRTAVSIAPETMGRLSELSHVIGVKEATGDLKYAAEMMEKVKSGFLLISGDDFTAYALLAMGGVGAISVTANILPRQNHDMFASYFANDREKAQKIFFEMLPFHRMMFVETNPIPVKAAAYHMGKIPTLEYRLPLCPLSPANEAKLKEFLKERGLLVVS
ncbi:MAG: 4-hydroxy-tetrahydrodipicolinate synthase [Brevinematales bacterium]|nr:4-hydroxy-tetrahydrodipicolinate synthase [Brevinematales bacterium]